MNISQTIRRELSRGIQERCFPGAVALVGLQTGEIIAQETAGTLFPNGPETNEDTIFDLASLTKVCATTFLAMKAVDENRLDLSRSVSSYLPAFGFTEEKQSVTVWHLLNHTGGLLWWKPFFERYTTEDYPFRAGTPEARQETLLRAAKEPLTEPPGQRSVYSDLDFMLLGWILEEMFGGTLDILFREYVAKPSGSNCHYRPHRYHPEVTLPFSQEEIAQLATLTEKEKNKRIAPIQNIAPTEFCRYRKGHVQGVVHDENAWGMGGISGHAGLFGTARDVFALACLLQPGKLISDKTLRNFCSKSTALGTYALGWDTPSLIGSSAGTRFSFQSVGHTGFTGTSLWIDRDRKFVSVLLTNRVFYGRQNEKIKTFRREFHEELGKAMDWPSVREM